MKMICTSLFVLLAVVLTGCVSPYYERASLTVIPEYAPLTTEYDRSARLAVEDYADARVRNLVVAALETSGYQVLPSVDVTSSFVSPNRILTLVAAYTYREDFQGESYVYARILIGVREPEQLTAVRPRLFQAHARRNCGTQVIQLEDCYETLADAMRNLLSTPEFCGALQANHH